MKPPELCGILETSTVDNLLPPDLNRIEIGDIVDVIFIGDSKHSLLVIGTPATTGDSWKLKRSDGEIFYVQLFQYMYLVKKGDGSLPW